MNIRERLLEIPELKIQKELVQMNPDQLNEYVGVLNAFIENYPAKEKELKEALAAEKYQLFFKHLISIKDMLAFIHADDLAEECDKQSRKLINVKHEKIEAYITYFLSTVSMLSIDIQMAVYLDGEKETNQAAGAGEELKSEGKRILAVDDNVFFLNILKEALRDTEHNLTCVTSGIAALKYLQNHRPNLYILDIEMPDMDGYELAQKIRSYGKKAPIIFLTGNASKEYVTRAMKSGAVDFITKPINKEYVQQRISKHIQTHLL